MLCQSSKRKEKDGYSHLNPVFNLFPPHSFISGSCCKVERILICLVFTEYRLRNCIVVIGLGFPTTLCSRYICTGAREQTLFDDGVVSDGSDERPRKGGIPPT